ncbi:NrsF family protein [Sphingopyxis sp.]|uniref:NrsF family protein n=1 Tax=Sphingopyxis sp. TaxID=1908224 RepID=UPI0035B4F2EF
MTDASIDDLIEALADELEPVRPRRLLRGALWVAAGWIVVGALLLRIFGMRHDLAAGIPMAPLPMLAFWLIVALGLAAAWSALRMGLPGVGRDYGGWRWAALAALALPLTAIFIGFGDRHGAMEAMHSGHGMGCTLDGLIAGVGVGAALFAWLRGGAPTSPERAGWVTGTAAGAAGAAAVALHCSSNDMIHIALWHGLAIPLWAVAGRLLLAPLLRW